MSCAPQKAISAKVNVASYNPPLVATVLARSKPEQTRVSDEESPPAGWKRDLWIDSCCLCPAIRPGLVLGEEDGYLVIQDPVSGNRHLLNHSAAAVFLLLNGSKTLRSVSADLCTTLSVERKRLDPDIHRVVCEMVGKRLLVLRRQPSLAKP